MKANYKQVVRNFIEEIWNQNQFDKLDTYIHPEYIDHSLPPALSPNKEGLQLWIISTGKSFIHKTTIEEMVSQGSKVMIKIKMTLKHIGKWRDIEPTGAEISAVGYRFIKLRKNKIIEHWALIDGSTIESQLKETSHGCKVNA